MYKIINKFLKNKHNCFTININIQVFNYKSPVNEKTKKSNKRQMNK